MGSKVGSMHGFLQRGRFDVTRLVKMGEKNSLAVLDYVPVLVGKDDAEMRTEIEEDQKTSKGPVFVSKGKLQQPRLHLHARLGLDAPGSGARYGYL